MIDSKDNLFGNDDIFPDETNNEKNEEKKPFKLTTKKLEKEQDKSASKPSENDSDINFSYNDRQKQEENAIDKIEDFLPEITKIENPLSPSEEPSKSGYGKKQNINDNQMPENKIKISVDKQSKQKPSSYNIHTAKEKLLLNQQPHREKRLSAEGDTPGYILQEARVRCNFSIEQVSIRTHISKHYIQAIERDDFSSLPAPVFVTAYIKALCREYGIEDLEQMIIEKLEHFENIRSVPNELIMNLHKNKQVNYEVERKFKNVLIVIALTFLVVIVLLILVYNYYWAQKSAPKIIENTVPQDTETYRKMSEEIRKKFSVPQFITPDELEVPSVINPSNKNIGE